MTRRSEIESNLTEVRKRIAASAQTVGRDPSEITLVVVTKNFPVSDIEILKGMGISNFGENRDQEAAPKAADVTATWHFQGQIQSNKLKSICSWASVIHSLDEQRHFDIIGKVASRPLQIFLQVNLDGALARGGASIESLFPLAQAVENHGSHNLVGLMAVAPLGIDSDMAFSRLALIHKEFLKSFPTATRLSAGMSGDYESAISHGATHLRIGSSILGQR